MMNPTSWTATEVEVWARQVGLSDTTISSLADNEIDGPTLVTLEKEELRSELNFQPRNHYCQDINEVVEETAHYSYQNCV